MPSSAGWTRMVMDEEEKSQGLLEQLGETLLQGDWMLPPKSQELFWKRRLWKILLPQVWQEGLKQTELSEITAHLSPPTFKKLIDPS